MNPILAFPLEPMFRAPGAEDKSHDYLPATDHEIDICPDPQLAESAREAAQRLYSEVRNAGVIDTDIFGFEVWAARLAPAAVAMYISGTYDWPVILIDLEKHRGSEKEEIFRSLRHELRHAVQESREEDPDEDDAEHFTTW